MKDRARIEDKMSAKDIELADRKEEAKYYVCNKIVGMIRNNNCDSEGSIDEGDLTCLKADCESLLKACEQIDKCKNKKAVRKIFYRYFDKEELHNFLEVVGG